MKRAKVFSDGKSQSVHLSENIRFFTNEILVSCCVNAIILVLKEAAWQIFLDGLEGYTDDFFQDGRFGEQPEK